jgi:hypothetical protein
MDIYFLGIRAKSLTNSAQRDLRNLGPGHGHGHALVRFICYECCWHIVQLRLEGWRVWKDEDEGGEGEWKGVGEETEGERDGETNKKTRK